MSSQLFSDDILWGRVDNQEVKDDIESDDEPTIDLLNDDDDEDTEGETDKDDEKEDEKKDDDESIEGKEEEELDLKEEDIELRVPPRKKEIEKVFPGFFKRFPEIEREYYKAQQFTEIIGTVEDAKDLIEKARVLEEFESNLENANTEVILKQVKENNPEAFAKIAENYLEHLAKVDDTAYYHVVEGVLKRGIFGALNQAKNSEDEELEKAALRFYKWMFPGDKELKPVGKLTTENPENDKLKKEREDFIKERFETAQRDLQGRIDNKIKSTLDANIDPQGKMTSYVKKNAIRDAMEQLESQIANDATFKRTVLDPLWKKAYEDKFSRTSLDKISAAYLSKTKSIIKSVIVKARNEALKGLGQRQEKDRKGPIIPGRSSTSSNSSGKIKAPEKGMKTLDYLNSD